MERPEEQAPNDEPYVEEQEEEAAAEAGRIGGYGGEPDWPEEERAVREGGGGEQEGFEEAEDELIENASHGDGDLSRDAFGGEEEIESDRSTADYGEADHVIVEDDADDVEGR
ncbi:MAG TPA: hypothetical protein VF752_16495 [Thermoleophilaceae bacterium]